MSFTGVGTILRRGQGTNPIPSPGTDTFDVVGRVRSISGPNIEKAEVEDNTLDSAGGFSEYLSGLKDPGSLEFVLSFTPGTTAAPENMHQQILADSTASTADSRRNWQVQWPDGTICDFQAEVFSASLNTEPNAPVDVNATLRLNGQPTFTYP